VLGGGRSGIVVDFFFYHGSVEIVCAETQGDLRDARRQHDPVRFDVVEIIEQETRAGDRL